MSNGVENTVEKEEIAHYEQFLLFPQFSKDFYSRPVKTGRACLGKSLCLFRILSICIYRGRYQGTAGGRSGFNETHGVYRL